MIEKMIDFIENSPTAFGAIYNIEKILKENGYKKLNNSKINKGEKYYLTRNDSSIIAINVGKELYDASMQICASHSDCPGFKLKPEAVIKDKYGTRLNIETYGGLLKRPWFDRPLILAGRVMVAENDKLTKRIFIDDKPICIIPSMAPHLSRDIEEKPINVSKELFPIVSVNDDFDLNEYLAEKLSVKKEDIYGFDLYLAPYHSSLRWGRNDEFFTCGHIDNLECAYTTLMGFINGSNDKNINIYACFDNEEVGSRTRQGADSDFLYNAVNRLCKDLELDYNSLLEQSMMLSCDNAHAIHPNYTDLYDSLNAPVINNGVVIKYNASQSYTTDSLSGGLFKKLLDDNKIKWQNFANKTGTRGGGTLGNISTSHLSIMSADIGLGQWAMHSPVETAGVKDAEYMIKACEAFYNAHLNKDEDDAYQFVK